MNWQKIFRGKVYPRKRLADLTTFRIGGSVRALLEPEDPEELRRLVVFLKREKVPYLLLGCGSNILAGDKSSGAVAIRLNAPYFKRISLSNSHIKVGAGLKVAGFLRYCVQAGLGGSEFLAGIPASIGGAVVMNAGIASSSSCLGQGPWQLADIIEKVEMLDEEGRFCEERVGKIPFGYRSWGFKGRIVIAAVIRFTSCSSSQVRLRIQQFLTRRRATQDLRFPSAGCVFKNPAGGESAGRLIDSCGLKGYQLGRAMISKRHANFVVNLGGAKAKDVLGLMGLMRKRVWQGYKILLEPEIVLFGLEFKRQTSAVEKGAGY